MTSVGFGRLLAGFIGAYAIGGAVALLIKSMGWWPGAAWEHAVMHAAHDTVSRPLDAIMLVLPLFGTNYSLGPIVIVASIILWRKGAVTAAAHLLTVQLGSWVLNPALKFTFPRDRPTLYEQRGQHALPAFPSGHSIAVTSVLFTAAWLIYHYRGQRWGFWVAGAFFVLNSYSRVYLSVHWPTDVIAGILVGAVWGSACFVAFRAAHENR